MKAVYILFTIVLIAHVAYSARLVRETTEVPDKSLTMEDVNKFIDKVYTSLKAEVEKVATKENLEKVQSAVQTAAQAAQKTLEDLRAKADEALKTAPAPAS